MSNSLWPHGLQHARLLCPPLSPEVCTDSCPLSRWCYLTISFCLQSFPASGYFPMSWLFASSGQSTRASASVTVNPMNIQGWFLLELTGLISLLCLLQHHSSKATILRHSAFLIVQLSHPYMTNGKTIAFTVGIFVRFLIHCQVCHSFPSKKQASFNFMAVVIIHSNFGAQEDKICHCFHFFPLVFAVKWWDQMPWS